MKWQAWNKWPLLGVVVTAVVVAAPSDTVVSVDGRKGTEIAVMGKSQPVVPAQPQQSLLLQGVVREKLVPQTERVELERLKRVSPETTSQKTEFANAFNVVSWYEPPPPPPPPAPVEAPVPVAPPCPFSYFGRYEDPPKRIVMLARNEQIYTVAEGDVIDETYRVEHITDRAVTLVYLPLGTIQSVNMGISINMSKSLGMGAQ